MFTALIVTAQSGGIAINNTGANPNSNAMLDIQSDNKGILIPRLTTVARNTLGTALVISDNGMMVYDKDMNLFFYWDGTQWVQVGSGLGDNWGTQVVQTSGTNISGDGTTANPLTVTDGDSDPTNEIELPSTATTNQVLTWDGTNWVAQNAPSGADNWGTQVVQTSGVNISGDGTTANPLIVTDGDSDPTNEIELPTGGTNGQVLTTDGSGIYSWVNDNAGTDDQNIQNLAFNSTTNVLTVGIENGNSQTVDLTPLLNDNDSDPTNEIQDLSLNTTTNILTITNNGTPTNIDLTSYLDNTDNQDLSLNGNTLSLTNDGTTVDLSGYLDNTDNQNISGSGLSGTILTIGIQNGTSETVDLFSLIDHDWYKVGTTSPPTSISDNIFTQGNVGIGITTPPNGSLQISSQTTSSGNGSFIATSIPQVVFHDNGGGDYSYITGFDQGILLGDNLSDYNVAMSNSTSPTPVLYVANTGKIGINTFTPTEKLEIQGSIKIVDGTEGIGKVLTSDAFGKGSWSAIEQEQSGTFTPVVHMIPAGSPALQANATLSFNATGKYVKKGSLVYVSITNLPDNTTCDGCTFFKISGLPFTATVESNFSMGHARGMIWRYNTVSNSYFLVEPRIDASDFNSILMNASRTETHYSGYIGLRSSGGSQGTFISSISGTYLTTP